MKRSGSRASKVSVDVQDKVESSFPGIPEAKWQELLEREETDMFILGIREEIVNKCLEICYNGYMEKQAVAFTVHCAYLAWLKVIGIYYMFRDPGDTDDLEVRKSWEPDEEPEPSVIDSRGGQCIRPAESSKQYPGTKATATSTEITRELPEVESLASSSFISKLFRMGEEEYLSSFEESKPEALRESTCSKSLSMSFQSLQLANFMKKTTADQVNGTKKK